MRVLKRKYARTALIMIGLGFAMIVLYCVFGSELFRWLFTEDIYRDSPAMSVVRGALLWGGVILLLLGALVRYKKLRCPYCRKGVAPAKWSYFDDFYCPRCGRAFPFDDEPDGSLKSEKK